ncbi:MAG TPA: hypothetical protein PLB00_13305 [Pseudomonadota bacterium]|nr:hypothetical protein [Pseudomonadota bacterium]
MIAALCLVTAVPGLAMADEPDQDNPPPESTEIQPVSEECLLLSLAGFSLELGCSQEEIDSIRARISGGTF